MVNNTAWTIEIIWVSNNTLYLLYLSATTPPINENRKEGNIVANSVNPNITLECVSEYITQLTAVFCIHVPINENDCPAKYNL